MNATHLHLVFNHAPVFGAIFGTAAWVWALAAKRRDPRLAALALFAVAALGVVVAGASGDAASRDIALADAVARANVATHEDAANLAAPAVIATALAALVAVLGGKKVAARRAALDVAVLVLALAADLLVGRAAMLGGVVRHPEISDAPPPPG